MIQSYAMAQPSKRLSLKVLRAKNESNNWVYAPRQQATLMDAALKIAGTDIASYCMPKHWPSDPDVGHGAQSGVGEASGYQLTALLPRRDAGSYPVPSSVARCLTIAELSKISHGGQYFSVDGRPLTTARGIGHDISKAFKSYLRAASSSRGQSTTITDPFFYLQIRCPEGSYDVNIEPAKDDVLFERPRTVRSLIEDLFRGVYGELPGSHPESPTKSRQSGKPRRDGFDLLMAQTESGECNPRLQETPRARDSNAYLTPFKSPLPVDSQRSRVNRDQSRQEATPSTEGRAKSRDLDSLNPWVFTKMNAPNRSPIETHSSLNSSRRFTLSATKQPRGTGGYEEQEQSMNNSALASPTTAFFSTETSPITAFQSPQSLQAPAEPSPVSESANRRDAKRKRDRDRYGNGALDTWFEKTTRVALQQDSVDAEIEQEEGEPPLNQLADARFGSPEQQASRDPDLNTPRSHIESGAVDETLGIPKRSWPSIFLDTELDGTSPGARNMAQARPTPSFSLQQSSLLANGTGLTEALEFERRKKEAMQKHRIQMKNRFEGSTAASSPHRSRYLAAKAALSSDGLRNGEEQTPGASDTTAGSTLSQDDPRAHLMRPQIAQPGPGTTKLQRTQTKQLPFERIPASYDIHDVCLLCPVDTSQLPSRFSKAAAVDSYTRTGTDLFALITPHAEDSLQLWKSRLSVLVTSKFKAKEEFQDPISSIDFTAMIHHLKNINQTGDLS